MTNQKYCRNCGEPNLPDAKFCASCGKAFVSAAATSPLTAPSAKPTPDTWKTPWNQSSQSSQPRTNGVSRKMIVVGIVVLFLLLTLGCLAVSTPSSPTPTPTPTPTPQGAISPTPQATISTTGPPIEIVPLGSWDTAFTKAGYVIVTPFTVTSAGFEDTISGVVKDGYGKLEPHTYTITIKKAMTRDGAKEEFAALTAKAQQQGYQPDMFNSERIWGGHIGSDKQVTVWIDEPSNLFVWVQSPFAVVVPGEHVQYFIGVTYEVLTI